MLQEIQRVLYDEATIKLKVAEIAAQLQEQLVGKEVILIGVLKGSFCFHADLARAMQLPIIVDFIACSSYGHSAQSSGKLTITKDIACEARGKEIVLVEDIVDTGLTLHALCEHLQSKQPASLHTVALLDKPSRRKIAIKPDYIGFTVPDEFIVGYGLDYAERFRHLPYIAILKPEVYKSNGCQKLRVLL